MIGIRWTLDADDAIKALDGYSKWLPRSMGVAMRVFLLRFVRMVITRRLSGPGGATDTLKRDTGNAIRSTAASPSTEITADLIRGSAGARPLYVKKHEEGWEGTEYVPAHWRRRTVMQKRAARVRLRKEGPSAKRLINTGRIFVRAHTRRAIYRARQMFRHTLREAAPLARGTFRQALLIMLRERRVPTAGDLQRINVGLFGA